MKCLEVVFQGQLALIRCGRPVRCRNLGGEPKCILHCMCWEKES